MLERTNVSTLATDDAAFHVVGWQLDHRDRRFRRMARGDALERIGDEVAGAPLRLRLRLLLQHPNAAGELVADQLFPTLQQVRLRFLQGEAGDALELGLLVELRLLQLVLELAEVDLTVREALVLAGQ